MPTKPLPEFVSYCLDQLQLIGPVSCRKMFGGYGLFLQGLMFGLIVNNTLYLKSDDTTASLFEAEGMVKFSYLRQGKPCELNFHQAPEACFEEQDAMSQWANRAYQVAIRAAANKA